MWINPLRNVCVCDGYIKQKPKYVLVLLEAFSPDVVVLPVLVTFIHTRHVPIVQHYRIRTLCGGASAVPLPPSV